MIGYCERCGTALDFEEMEFNDGLCDACDGIVEWEEDTGETWDDEEVHE